MLQNNSPAKSQIKPQKFCKNVLKIQKTQNNTFLTKKKKKSISFPCQDPSKAP